MLAQAETEEGLAGLLAREWVVPTLLLPAAFGGHDGDMNRVPLPLGAVAEKAAVDEEVARRANEGAIGSYEARPVYDGKGRIPTALRIIAEGSDPLRYELDVRSHADLEDLAREHAPVGALKSLAIADVVQSASDFQYDMREGVLRLGRDSYRASVLGSTSFADGTWMWSWANPSVSELPGATKLSASLRDRLGRDAGIVHFREGRLPLFRFDVRTVLTASVGTLGSGGHVGIPSGEQAEVVLVFERCPGGDPKQTGTQRFGSALMSAIADWSLDHGRAVEQLASYVGGEVDVRNDRQWHVRWGRSQELRCRFDERGRLTKVEG